MRASRDTSDLTFSRSRDVSSPKTSLPAQSTITIPSERVRTFNFNCITNPPKYQQKGKPKRRAGQGRKRLFSTGRMGTAITYNRINLSMSYQVLARKYRPQKFSDVIGQEHVTRTLKNAIEQGRTAHGYIFSGHRGIGKTTVARILAMSLNCRSTDRPVPEPCGVCESCTEIRAGNSVDVIEIDAATNRGIDEIRELREAARYRPARDRFKIYILDEAHQITDAAFNALLKTLEEPPSHVVFMLATTQPEDIPQTIRSRC